MLFAMALAATVAAVSPPRPVRPTDVYRIRAIDGIEVSPDGRTLAISIERADREDDAFRHEVLLTDALGRNGRPLCRPDVECTDPRFSPDGTKIAYLSDEKDDTQLWVARVASRRGRPVTDGSEPPLDFDWSPDGTKLVFARLDAYVRIPPPGAPRAEGGRSGEARSRRGEAESVAPWVITRTQIQRDGEGFLDDRRTHLWVVPATGGNARRITSGPWDDDTPRWSPKGDRIAFVSNRHDDPDATDDTDLFAVPAAGGNAAKLAGTPGPDVAPAWSPTGDRIAFVASLHPNDPYRITRLMVASAAGGPPVDLTGALDAWVSADDMVGGGADPARPQWTADGSALYVTLDRRGANRLVRVPAGGGTPREIVGGAQVVGLVRWAAATGRLYYARSTPTAVSELWTVSGDGTGARRLLDANAGLSPVPAFVAPERLVAKNSAGEDVASWLYPPLHVEPGKRYPLILYVHGGPQDYDGDYFDLGLENQLFPAHGWGVLRVNYRGSTSYGEAFCRAIRGDWGPREYEDLMAALDGAVATHRWIDPGRLGIGGWSYGGIMTLWTVGHTDRFKVGVPERFEIDYLSCFGEDQWQAQYVTEFGSPFTNAEAYRRASPVTYLARVTTPLYLIADEDDGNCPPSQAMQLYQRLKLQGVPTALVVYPGEPHTMTLPSHDVDRLYRLVDWFGTWLGK